MSAFRSLSLAMLKGLLRDRTASFFTLIFPLMFLLLFGALFQNDSVSRSHVLQFGEVAVLDEMPADQRRGLSEALDVEQVADRDEALARVSDGDADAVVWEDEDGRIELRYSAADAARAGTVQGLMQSLVQTANLAETGQPPAFELASDQVEDKSIKAIQYLAPGLLGWAIAMGASFMSAFTLVNWRKKRILRRLWLAPISPGTVIGARVGVSLGMAFLQTALFLGVATIPFYGLQLTGFWWLAIPLVACGTLAFMSVGLLIGAWAKTDESANAALQLVIMPMAFLSGSFFPLDASPDWVRAISNAMPLKHLNEAVQGVLTRGEGWGAALPAMGGLLLFAAVVTAVAARLFRWDDT
ncbi:ABC transporter permease [Streptomyces sp. 3MP-14]|uniref:Transport permease protein n=1 Tax=Streptomyces mimosae TaxID=2586635 RepID=A0A5N6ALD9_9ACTN|nr:MULTISPECIES: ABC transporter permease [Streptomyces]KAB8169667.1 ABC transporter permease [Streptomyces mimosae]KAB8178415.1 ABC transporter permease [Streptomyces sp. 3MP-14]